MAKVMEVEASDIRFVAEPEPVVILTREEKNRKHIEYYVLLLCQRNFDSKQPHHSLNVVYKQLQLFKRVNHVQS